MGESADARNLPGTGLSAKSLALAKEVAKQFSGGFDVSHSVTFVIVDSLRRMVATADANVAPPKIVAAIPGSRLVVVPGGGHLALESHHEAVSAVILELLLDDPP